ncbi:GAF domain-containing protein [Thermomicrobiaceae bacterium CFH 74404]|uniref:GAF domain-containing protein n=1 Tax=Thermalbibacter longus TaxID=2951981 RepID=A0AA41WB75_9BACT|nr:GAF domain-containing protein [Thermalbibacter longus]MCM8749412.1 GAF domain-containing protein [Thermalbibacter longus]
MPDRSKRRRPPHAGRASAPTPPPEPAQAELYGSVPTLDALGLPPMDYAPATAAENDERPTDASHRSFSPGSESGEEPEPAFAPRDAKALLQTLIDQLTRSVRADLGTFFVYDEQQRTVEFAAHTRQAEDMLAAQGQILRLAPEEIPAEAEVIRTGKPLHLTSVDDFRRFPPANPVLREQGQAGRLVGLVVPLLWERQAIGVAYLWRSRHPVPFETFEIRLAEELCALATIAIHAHRRYLAEQQQRQLLETLLDVSQAVASLPDLDQILAVVVHTVSRTLQTDATTIYVYTESGEGTAAFFHHGLSAHELNVAQTAAAYSSSDIPVERRVRETLKPVLVPAADFPTEFVPLGHGGYLPTDREVTEALALPLVDRGRMVGVCYTWSHDPNHRFDPQAIDTAAALLNAAAGAITRARLQEQTERHLEELQALWQVARTVGPSRTLDEALDQIASALSRLIAFDTAIIAEPDGYQPGRLVIRWAWGDEAARRVGLAVPIDGSLAGHVFKTGKSVNVADTASDPRTYRPENGRFAIRSVLIEPLVHEERPIGVFGLGRLAGPGFTQEEERLFAVLAQEASTAVALIQAREALERREREQALLAELGDALLSARDPAEMIDIVARHGLGVLGEAVGVTFHWFSPDQVEAYTAYHVDPVRSERSRSLLQHGRSPALVTWLAQGEGPRIVRRPELEGISTETEARLRALMDVAAIQAIVAHAWRVEERVAGLLIGGLERDDPARVTATIALMRAIGERLAAAVERWQAAQARESLLRVTREFAQQLELSALLRVIVRELAIVLPHDRFILFEADETARLLRPLLQSEAYRNVLGESWTLPYGQGLSGAVAVSRQAELVLDARSDARVLYGDHEELGKTHSLMAAPLIAQNRLLGVLLVGRVGADRFTAHEFQTFQLFASQAAVALWQAQQRERERSLYRASVEVLAATVDAKDPYTHHHSRNVARYARLLAEAMGCSPEEIEQIELAGLLHDIGKIGVPDHILRKPGPLTPEEWERMKTHAALGADILASHPALQPIVPLVRHHHERWDGQGYPDGLHGPEIPLGAAIIGLADAFDTMTSDRPYRRAMPVAAAVEELSRCSGTQFHPDVVAAFQRLLESSPELAELVAASTLQRFPPTELTEFAVLHELGERLGQITSFETLAETIDLALTGSLGASDLSVLLLDETTGELVLRYSRWYPEAVGTFRLSPGQGASWEAIASGRPLNIPDVNEHPAVARIGPRPIKPMLVAPLMIDEKAIGSITVSKTSPEPFSDRDARILAAIARQIGPLVRLLAQVTLSSD